MLLAGIHNFLLFLLEKSNVITIGLLILILTIYMLYLHHLHSGTPPGPWGIPIFGYTLFLSKEPYKDFIKMGKKYGDIFSIGLGPNCCIVLNNLKTIKEGFTKAGGLMDGRQHDAFTMDFGENKMVAFTDGEIWRSQRRFILSAMKDFGLEKNELEHYINKEAEIAADVLLKANGQPYELKDVTYTVAANTMCYLMLGHRFSDKEKHVVDALKAIDHLVNNFGFTSPVNALKSLIKYLPEKLTGIDVLYNSRKILYDYADKLLENHEKTFDENNLRDLIDVYIMKRKRDNDPNEIYTKPYIRAMIAILFISSAETSSSLMNWTLKTLAVYPEIQKRLQDEIDNVLGNERHATMDDLNRMPYTEAVMLEILRYISLLPATPVFHRVTEDITLNGYRIPKDSLAVANIWNVHYDPDLWKNPEVFNPERFLDKDGIIGKLRENVVAFSIGKRRCLGENLARIEYFLVLTTLLQKLTFVLPKGTKWPFEVQSNIPVRKCYENKICAIARVK